MLTSVNKVTEQVQARAVRFAGNVLYVALSDRREISAPLDQVEWLAWLTKATPEQRAKWSIVAIAASHACEALAARARWFAAQHGGRRCVAAALGVAELGPSDPKPGTPMEVADGHWS